ncbi:uncharacterized protein EHS24_005638 [Apiotrichum porosum]|uniref:Uncharacterized protein n=1 Tax=Apiotrichum porosum TaxID=105984 RepID=A0A427XZJ8_9TREE|nr:uncharacterized protein EHS24_005638 [Apiotrichum porosum]RSH84135.1 hypothetical protein EHS24_005638 [Apiotrichum porosum]
MLSLARLAARPVSVHASLRRPAASLFNTTTTTSTSTAPRFYSDEKRRLRDSVVQGSSRGLANRDQLDMLLDSDRSILPSRRSSATGAALSDYQSGGSLIREPYRDGGDRPRSFDRERPRSFDRDSRGGRFDSRRGDSRNSRRGQVDSRGSRSSGGGSSSGRFDRDRQGHDDARGQGRDDARGKGRNVRGKQEAGVAQGEATPYMTSLKIKKWIDRHVQPISFDESEQVIRMVEETPSHAVNAAVYNLVFALLGRSKRYTRMWKVYNSMKKRFVKPTSRTYTTLLNAYAGVAHSDSYTEHFVPGNRPEPLTLERVRAIYASSQKHIQACKTKIQKQSIQEEVGVSYPQSNPEPDVLNQEEESITKAINILPTNAYLKFLGRFGYWEEMERVFLAMDREGPLSPDQVTYWAMLKAAQNIHTFERLQNDRITKHQASGITLKPVKLPTINFGATVRSYWEQAIRQLRHRPADYRKIDPELAILVVECLSVARPEDKRLAQVLVPRLWGLPSATQPEVASSRRPDGRADFSLLPKVYETLPVFRIDVRIATTLLTLYRRAKDKEQSRFYTHFFLEHEELRKDFDMGFMRAATLALAAADDITGVQAIMDSYQPSSGKGGWPLEVWNAALSAARWSGDWDAALAVFRRMTHLPPGVETSKGASGEWTFKSPNGRPVDARGVPWVQAHPIVPDPTTMAILFKAAIACGERPTRQVLRIYNHFGAEYWNTIVHHLIRGPSRARVGEQILDLRTKQAAVPVRPLTSLTRHLIADRVELAKDVETAAQRIVYATTDELEKETTGLLRDRSKIFVKYWSEFLSGKTQHRRDTRDGDVEEGEGEGEGREALEGEEGDGEGEFEGEDRAPRYRRDSERPDRSRFQGSDRREGGDRSSYRNDREGGERRFQSRDGGERRFQSRDNGNRPSFRNDRNDRNDRDGGERRFQPRNDRNGGGDRASWMSRGKQPRYDRRREPDAVDRHQERGARFDRGGERETREREGDE